MKIWILWSDFGYKICGYILFEVLISIFVQIVDIWDIWEILIQK